MMLCCRTCPWRGSGRASWIAWALGRSTTRWSRCIGPAIRTIRPGSSKIVDALNSVAETVVFPAHPRTQQALASLGARLSERILQIDPVSYFDMLELEENARLIATDSGGVQREAYCLGVPCLTLREETEWVETVQAGWNLLVGVDPHQIVEAWRGFHPHGERPPIFGDGHAAERIVRILEDPGVRFGAAHQWNRFAGSHAAPIGVTV